MVVVYTSIVTVLQLRNCKTVVLSQIIGAQLGLQVPCTCRYGAAGIEQALTEFNAVTTEKQQKDTAAYFTCSLT